MRLARSLTVIASLVSLALGGCVDTSLPDLSLELGTGRTDGPYCTPDDIDFFPPEELRIHVIDVGQGDSIWVQTPYYDDKDLESRNILIDAGPASSGGVVVDYMLSHGMVSGGIIHALVITHAHEDHYGGVPYVASVFEIARYVDPGYGATVGFLNARNSAEADVQSAHGVISVPAVPSLVPRLYTNTDLFGVYVDATLIASSATASGSPDDGTTVNNTSVAFAIRWSLNQVLLTGDIEHAVEDQLIVAHDAGEINLQSRVLKVAHHGSSSSSSREFLARVFPTLSTDNWAVISSGRKSFSGTTLPTVQTLTYLGEVLPKNHVLSTENRDDIKPSGGEANDDHILVRLKSDGTVESCYTQ